MTYHVRCPISGKTFDFESIIQARVFVLKMMKRYNCNRTVLIHDGKRIAGRMWMLNRTVYWKSNGVRVKRIVNLNGTLRRNY